MHSSELTQERRQLYRMTLGEENQVEVAVWTDNGDGLVGEVVDISGQGVAIRVPRNVTPVLSLGESVAFPFTPRTQTEPVALRATVRSRNLMGKHWRYGFKPSWPRDLATPENENRFLAYYWRRDRSQAWKWSKIFFSGL